MLRWFRDNFVLEEDIEHYYKIAPIIVQEINNDLDSNLVYGYIFDSVIVYCIKQIENGNYVEAYNRYRNSVLNLEERYARPALEQRLIRCLKLSR